MLVEMMQNSKSIGHYIWVSELQLALFGDELASASGFLKEYGVFLCTEPAFL